MKRYEKARWKRRESVIDVKGLREQPFCFQASRRSVGSRRMSGGEGRMKRISLVLPAVIVWMGGVAHAEVVEETYKLTMEVTTAKGQSVRRPTDVTVFRDTARAKSPFVVINHGRVVPREGRAAFGRVRYPDIS